MKWSGHISRSMGNSLVLVYIHLYNLLLFCWWWTFSSLGETCVSGVLSPHKSETWPIIFWNYLDLYGFHLKLLCFPLTCLRGLEILPVIWSACINAPQIFMYVVGKLFILGNGGFCFCSLLNTWKEKLLHL